MANITCVDCGNEIPISGSHISTLFYCANRGCRNLVCEMCRPFCNDCRDLIREQRIQERSEDVQM